MLSRAARRQGNFDFNIGGLVFEITEKKDLEKDNIPTAWIEVVISQIDMKEIISDEVLEIVNKQVQVIREKTQRQAKVFELLKQEV